MANARVGNVIRLDTTGTIPGPAGQIKSILYIGATGATAVLRANGVSGTPVWERSGDVEVEDGVYIRYPNSTENMHITIANGAVVYLYTC